MSQETAPIRIILQGTPFPRKGAGRSRVLAWGAAIVACLCLAFTAVGTTAFASEATPAGFTSASGHPDFTVTAIATMPAILTTGCVFSAQVTVNNVGAAAGDAGTLKFWVNHNANATVGEASDAQKAVGTLAAGANTTVVFTGLRAPNANGTYSLRAYADANAKTIEESEGDNQKSVTYSFCSPVVYGAKPDFVVENIAFTPATLTTGCLFTATVTVKNAGTGAGNAGNLRVWANHAAAAVKYEGGGVQVAAGTLAAGASANVVVAGLRAPTTNGTFGLRAFVDVNDATVEQSEANNQKCVTYTLASPPVGKPDFLVDSVMFNPVTLTTGCLFTATVTVRNAGTGSGKAGTLRVYVNHPATAVAKDIADGQAVLGVLAAGASTMVTISGLHAPKASGTYSFRAFADASELTEEESEGNNQRCDTYNLVATSVGKPDFLVDSVMFNPITLTTGCLFTATVTVRNAGTGSGNAGTLRVYVNHLATAVAKDIADGQAAVGVLAAGASTMVTITGLHAPKAGGTYNFRAFADASELTAEESEGNNQRCDTYTLVAAPVGQPDFVVDDITFNPITLTTGCVFTATVAVRNAGTGAGSVGSLRVWVNHAAVAVKNETGDAQQTVAALAPGATSRVLFTGLHAPKAFGTYNFRAFADANAQTLEQSESNDQKCVTYSLGPAPGAKPDFVVSDISFSPLVLTTGCTFTAYVTILNQGSLAGDAGYVDVWLDHSNAAVVGDVGNACQAAGSLAVGEQKIKTFTGLHASAQKGTYTFRAFVDSRGKAAEQSEGNNQRTRNYEFH